MDLQQVAYEVSEGIATVTLNRPEKLNAWTSRMADEIRHCMSTAAADDAVKVIILTGAGRGFCAGADMNDLTVMTGEGAGSISSSAPEAFDPGSRQDFQRRYAYFPSVPKPILAAINGPCAGLGLVIALYCDMRFSAAEAVYTTSFSRRGLVAEHGISWILPKHVGLSTGLDLLLSARRVNAEEALRIGLVDRVIPSESLVAEVRAYAMELATMVSPRSMKVMKQQIWNAQFQTLAEAIDVADVETALSLGSEDFREGVSHFIERRKPAFTGR